jgi:hypothetical protein
MRIEDFLVAIRDAPETNLVLFGFLMSFPWEMLQAPLYVGMAEAPHWSATLHCLVATLGDCVLFLAAFGMTAAIFRNRRWIRTATFMQVFWFTAIGLTVTVLTEAAGVRGIGWNWQYSALMPRLPLLGTGLSPVLQWLVLPPLVIRLVRQQLRAS